jgi:hypothetical protein
VVGERLVALDAQGVLGEVAVLLAEAASHGCGKFWWRYRAAFVAEPRRALREGSGAGDVLLAGPPESVSPAARGIQIGTVLPAGMLGADPRLAALQGAMARPGYFGGLALDADGDQRVDRALLDFRRELVPNSPAGGFGQIENCQETWIWGAAGWQTQDRICWCERTVGVVD